MGVKRRVNLGSLCSLSAFQQRYYATLDEDDRPGFQAFGNLLSVCFKPVCLTWSDIYCQFEGFLVSCFKNRTSPGGATVLKSSYFSRYTCMFSQLQIRFSVFTLFHLWLNISDAETSATTFYRH